MTNGPYGPSDGPSPKNSRDRGLANEQRLVALGQAVDRREGNAPRRSKPTSVFRPRNWVIAGLSLIVLVVAVVAGVVAGVVEGVVATGAAVVGVVAEEVDDGSVVVVMTCLSGSGYAPSWIQICQSRPSWRKARICSRRQILTFAPLSKRPF